MEQNNRCLNCGKPIPLYKKFCSFQCYWKTLIIWARELNNVLEVRRKIVEFNSK